MVDINATTAFKRPRHGKFDDYYETHQKFLWWWSRRIAWIINRSVGKRKWEAEDFIGFLTIWFNDCLHRYDPDVTKFTSFFSNYLISQILRNVIHIDCERRPLEDIYNNAESRKSKTYYESGNRLYRFVPNDDWTTQILDLLGDDPFGFLTRTMRERHRTILELRFKHGKTMQETGRLMGVSRERIRQIEVQAMESIRHRLERLEPVRELFFGQTPTETRDEEVQEG